MEKKVTNQELEKELHLLRLDKKKSERQVETFKNSFIRDIKSFNKENVSNTIFTEKTYTIWQRIKKVLGMN